MITFTDSNSAQSDDDFASFAIEYSNDYVEATKQETKGQEYTSELLNFKL